MHHGSMHHGSPYALKVGKSWKVVVPIRGRLSPKFCKTDFCDKSQADAWLRSEAAQAEIDAMRERPVVRTKPSVRGIAQPLHA